MFNNVVVGVDDLERGRDALELAKAVISDDAEVALVYVEVLQGDPAVETDTGADAETQRFGLERLGRLRDELHPGASVSRIQAPSVRDGVHDFAAGRGADLIVIGAGSREVVAHSVLGDEAREVLENPPCTVAVAPRGYAAHSHRLRSIGVGYNGSAESEQALALARTIASERHATLSAFEAVRTAVYPSDIWNVEAQIDDDVEKARQRIAALGDVEPRAAFADDAVDGLRRYGASVDLLVVGSHRYRAPDHLLKHSTSQRLADDPPSPLLVLASAGVNE